MSEFTWYYAKSNEQKGPVSEDELKRLLSSGELSSKSLVWHKGMPNWLPAKECPELDWMRATHDPPTLPHPVVDPTALMPKMPPPLPPVEPQSDVVSNTPSHQQVSPQHSPPQYSDREVPPAKQPPSFQDGASETKTVYPMSAIFYFIALCTAGYGIYVGVTKTSPNYGGPESALAAVIECVIDLLMAGCNFLFGFFGRKVKWVYITGLVFFALDALFTVFGGISAGIVMKVVIIGALVRGLKGEIVTVNKKQ